MKISDLVAQTIATGVPPLELSYRTIRDCRTQNPFAYRTMVVVNSVELGTITQNDYSKIADSDDILIRVSEWAIQTALRQREAFIETGRRIKWISVYCPVSFALLPDLYERVKALLGGKKDTKPIKLCLEFPDSILLNQSDISKAILDLKLLGVHTMVACNDENTCAFFKLAEAPFDTVILSNNMTKHIDNRNKPNLLPSLISYLLSIDVSIIADDLQTTEHIRLFSRYECEAYLQKGEGYKGADEAVLEQDGDE